MNVHALDVSSANLASLSHEAALRELHEYLGYLRDGDASNAMDVGHVAGSIVTLARLDDFMATTQSCLR